MKYYFSIALVVFATKAAVAQKVQTNESKMAFERSQLVFELKQENSLFLNSPFKIKDFGQKYKNENVELSHDKLSSKIDSSISQKKIKTYISDLGKKLKLISNVNPNIYLGYNFTTSGSRPHVVFRVSGSNDPDGSIISYEFIYGDGTSQMIPASDLQYDQVYHVYDNPGSYNVTVKATDNSGGTSEISKNILVESNNLLPIPKFSVSTNHNPNYSRAYFYSRAIATGQSPLFGYGWDFGDGTSNWNDSSSVVKDYAMPGTYNVTFVVNQSLSNAVANSKIYVGMTPPAGGSPPVSVIRANTQAGEAPLVVSFDGTNSFDIEGKEIVEYEWNFGDWGDPKNVSKLAQPNFKYTQPGAYYGSLKTKNSAGVEGTEYFTVYVKPSVSYPQHSAKIVALANYSGPRKFSFDSSAYAIHTPVNSWSQVWDFGDGSPKVKQAFPTHAYSADGTYLVTLKIYDVFGGTQEIQKQLVVTELLDSPHSNFYMNDVNPTVGYPVDFFSDNQNAPLASTTVTMDFGDGVFVSGTEAEMSTVTHTYSRKGLFKAARLVTNVNGTSNITTQWIAVQDASWPVRANLYTSNKVGHIPFTGKLDASLAESANIGELKYFWSVSEDGGIYNSYEDKIIFPQFKTPGAKFVTLFVEDSEGNIGINYENFVAVDPNLVPGANRPPDTKIRITLANPSMFLFRSNLTTDPDGDMIGAREWTLDGNYLSSYGTTLAEILENGEHTITLKTTDIWGASSEVSRTFYKGPTSSPQINFSVNPIAPTPGTNVNCSFNNAGIPASKIKQIVWDFGDGSTDCCNLDVTHVFAAPGNYTVKLTVTDVDNRNFEFSRLVRVQYYQNISNFFSYSPQNPIVNSPVNFVSSAASLPNYSSPQSHIWDFGNGNFELSGENVSKTFTLPGSYLVTHIFNDWLGYWWIETQSIQVSGAKFKKIKLK